MDLSQRGPEPGATPAPVRAHRPWAALYRGHGAVPGCAEVWRPLLRSVGLRTRYVGPGERLDLAAAVRRAPTVLVHPGGGELEEEWCRVADAADDVARYVRDGGRYLGVCLGGYLAGATPGYDLLPGDVDQRDPSQASTASGGAVDEVVWEGRQRRVYVEDPPVFEVDERVAQVFARYADGRVAGVSAGCGAGRVVVCGPHPEATTDWYLDEGLPVPPPTTDLASGLLRAALA